MKLTHSYVTRIQQQSFKLGFRDMLIEGTRASSFLNGLMLRYLDYMLRGLEEDIISLYQWKQFTLGHLPNNGFIGLPQPFTICNLI